MRASPHPMDVVRGALEADEGVVVGDGVVHVLGVRRAVRVRVRQVHARAVVVVRRARAAVRRLVVRLVPGQRARRARARARARRARLGVRRGAVAPATWTTLQ